MVTLRRGPPSPRSGPGHSFDPRIRSPTPVSIAVLSLHPISTDCGGCSPAGTRTDVEGLRRSAHGRGRRGLGNPGIRGRMGRTCRLPSPAPRSPRCYSVSKLAPASWSQVPSSWSRVPLSWSGRWWARWWARTWWLEHSVCRRLPTLEALSGSAGEIPTSPKCPARREGSHPDTCCSVTAC